MRTIKQVIVCTVVGGMTSGATLGQGTFQNLDFESPILPLSVDSNGFVPISDALPYWIGYLGGIQRTTVLYNGLTAGSGALGLLGPGYPNSGIIQGQYTAVLQAGALPSVVGAALAQTGMISLDAQSLRFLVFGPAIVVTFGGQSLSLAPLMSGPGLGTFVGADISAFAGQIGELRFAAPYLPGSPNNVFLDDISFSPQAVPEPSVLGIFAIGALLLGWRLHSRSRV